MIRLGELVGAILNEMTIARTKTRLLGAQMAADFSDHELLRDLPIPIYKMEAAELSVPFVVAKTSPETPDVSAGQFDTADLAAAAKKVSLRLPDLEGLEEGFLFFDNQRDQWTREVTPVIAERFAADAIGISSIDGTSRSFGYLVKGHYLVSLLKGKGQVQSRKIRETIESGRLDLLESSARQLLRDELRAQAESSTEQRMDRDEVEAKRIRPDKSPEIGGNVFVLAEAHELKDKLHVSTLSLKLEEDTIVGMTVSSAKEERNE